MARAFLEMLRANILPEAGDAGAASEADLEAARARDAADEARGR